MSDGFKTKIHFLAWLNNDRGSEVSASADGEIEIRLPFPPFPGLTIEIAGPDRDDKEDFWLLNLTSVRWEVATSTFHCGTLGQQDKSLAELRDTASDMEKAGFVVERTGI